MGFKVCDDGQGQSRRGVGLQVLSSVDARQLDALHLIAAIAYPVPAKLCEDLLPSAIDWKTFWTWLARRRWARRVQSLVLLDKKVAEQCRKNKTAQCEAC